MFFFLMLHRVSVATRRICVWTKPHIECGTRQGSRTKLAHLKCDRLSTPNEPRIRNNTQATNSEQHTGHFAHTLKAKKFLALPHPWGSKCLQLSAFLTCSYLTFQHCNLCFVPTVSNVWSSTQGNKVHTLSRKTEISTRQQTPACRWRCCDCYLYDLFYSSSTFWTSFHGSLIFKNYVKKSLF